MTHREFLKANPVFTRADFAEHCVANGGPVSASGQQAALRRFIESRDLRRTRKGFYKTHPSGKHHGKQGAIIRHYEFLMWRVPGAVISHYAALLHEGCAYTMARLISYSALEPCREIKQGEITFCGVRHPKVLREIGQTQFDVLTETDHCGTFRVTDVPRTFADCLRRPAMALGWEEIWESYKACGVFGRIDLERMVVYIQLLGEPLLAARAGLLMEMQRELVPCKDATLKALEAMAPSTSRYLHAEWRSESREKLVLARRWNLIVPHFVAFERWKEPRGLP